MLSVKQSGLRATSLVHILLAALLVSHASLPLQPAWARVINADRRLLSATDKVTKLVANKETEMFAIRETPPEANKETQPVANTESEMEATEDKPVRGAYWGGGGGGGYGHGGVDGAMVEADTVTVEADMVTVEVAVATKLTMQDHEIWKSSKLIC